MRFWDNLKYSLVGWAAGVLLRLWFSTCRIEPLDNRLKDEFVRDGQSALMVSWHRAVIYGVHFLARQCKAAALISLSKDGEYLARLARTMGIVPVRGSSNRGGKQALDELVRYMNSGAPRYAATVADGPRGPRYKAKKGMIVLSMRTRVPLLTYMWSCDNAWVFKNAWDKTMLPKPFSRIVITSGKSFTYPEKMSSEEMDAALIELEQELNRLTQKVDAKVGYIDPV
jgi:lysophospholipid acyltransferase (LPLAT)-like uncharacterized protein